MTTYANIAPSAITASIQVRKIAPQGVKRLAQSINERGYLERYPLAVTSVNGTGEYKLLDGNHRLEAVRQLELESVPVQIFDGLMPDDEYRIAYESNRGQDAIVLQDWTDDAEFIWSLAAQGKTQQQIADIMRWSRTAVANYQSLRSITPDAWQLIVVTTKAPVVTTEEASVVTSNVTTVTFTEGLLRSITSLTAPQQLSLVKDLAAGRITKDKFKTQAERYRTRNSLIAEAEKALAGMPTEYMQRVLIEIEKGIYDKAQRADFDKLIQQMRDEYEKKQDYTLICADITTGLQDIPDDSIDVIITDPPYPREYIPLYEDLAKLAARVLKPGGSLLVMCGQSYLPEVFAMMTPHIAYHWTVTYLTPGGQAVQLWQRNVNTFWKPVLWFVNGEYDGKWTGDVCKSDTNDNDKRYHEWGQSVSGMASLVEKFSKTGERILDPFCGAGTTGVAALRQQRKFTGVDIDADHIETARKRFTEATNV